MKRDAISGLPEEVARAILSDLDPQSLTACEESGGDFSRAARKSSILWLKLLGKFEWLLGNQDLLTAGQGFCLGSEGRRLLKERCLRLTSQSEPKSFAAGHILLVGGNVERSVAFSSPPSWDVTAVRDVPSLHRLRAHALDAKESSHPQLQGRPFYRSIAPLKEVRSPLFFSL